MLLYIAINSIYIHAVDMPFLHILDMPCSLVAKLQAEQSCMKSESCQVCLQVQSWTGSDQASQKALRDIVTVTVAIPEIQAEALSWWLCMVIIC